MRKILIVALFAVVCFGSITAKSKKLAGERPVYMFAYTHSFKDSVCYISSVQLVEGAKLDKDGMLQDRAVYSNAFAKFVGETIGQNMPVSSVHFFTNKLKAERAQSKLRTQSAKRGQKVVKSIPASDFAFKARTYDYDN